MQQVRDRVENAKNGLFWGFVTRIDDIDVTVDGKFNEVAVQMMLLPVRRFLLATCNRQHLAHSQRILVQLVACVQSMHTHFARSERLGVFQKR
eukprot:5654191-Amphidinium_carterae.1